MMIPLLMLANATQADPMISGDWILKLIGAMCAGAALIAGRYWGRKEASETKLADPVPEVPVKRVYSPPTFYQHQELMRRVDALEKGTTAHREYVEGQFRAIRRENSEQFITLMNAGESRKDAIMEEVRTEMNRIYERINKLADQLKR